MTKNKYMYEFETSEIFMNESKIWRFDAFDFKKSLIHFTYDRNRSFRRYYTIE